MAHSDPADTDPSNGISEITVPVKDIVVNLATDGTGALTSTAAQVVAAINADAAASALVTPSPTRVTRAPASSRRRRPQLHLSRS